MGVGQVDLSLTHSKGMAAAVAILSIVEEDLK
jgi:phosphopantetheinyl transferase (holo-ACP synthase)